MSDAASFIHIEGGKAVAHRQVFQLLDGKDQAFATGDAFGGETVGTSAKTPIAQVVRELEMLHATYLNSAYHRGTLQQWRGATFQGENAYQHIARRLGYRLVAQRLRYSSPLKAGDLFRFELDLKNGF